MVTGVVSTETELATRGMWSHIGRYVGFAIRVVRVAQKKTQEELAELLTKVLRKTVRQSYVSKVETGEVVVTWEKLGAICAILQTSPAGVVQIAESLMVNEDRDKEDVLTDILAVISENRDPHELSERE